MWDNNPALKVGFPAKCNERFSILSPRDFFFQIHFISCTPGRGKLFSMKSLSESQEPTEKWRESHSFVITFERKKCLRDKRSSWAWRRNYSWPPASCFLRRNTRIDVQRYIGLSLDEQNVTERVTETKYIFFFSVAFLCWCNPCSCVAPSVPWLCCSFFFSFSFS
jgi:hypothetical protein